MLARSKGHRKELGALLATVVAASAAQADTLRIPEDFGTINAAINAAETGDLLVVGPGTYVGAFDLREKSLSLIGYAGASSTILDGRGNGPVVIIGGSDGITPTLRGVTITGGDANNGGGLFVGGVATIEGCVFDGNNARRGGGAFVAADARITRCTFVNNSASEGGAIYIGADSIPTLEDCTIENNSAVSGAAVFLSPESLGRSVPEIHNCELRGNESDFGGAVFVALRSLIVSNSTFEDNNAGSDGGAVLLFGGGTTNITETTFTNNSSSGIGGAIGAMLGSALVAEACTFTSNSAGVGGAVSTETDALGELFGSTFCQNAPNDLSGDALDLGSNDFACGTDAQDGCPIDYAAPQGVLDIIDVLAFVYLVQDGKPEADLAAPYGRVEINDVLAFLQIFQAGCE